MTYIIKQYYSLSNKVCKINLNTGLLTQIYVFRMFVTPPAKRQRVSELSQALTQVTQVNTATRTYTVDLTSSSGVKKKSLPSNVADY
jgi:hypothetical protein